MWGPCWRAEPAGPSDSRSLGWHIYPLDRIPMSGLCVAGAVSVEAPGDVVGQSCGPSHVLLCALCGPLLR